VTANWEETGRLTDLFRRVNSDLYRANPFRIAGLNVDATSREVARQFERLRMLEKWAAGAGAPQVPFGLPSLAGSELRRQAQERLTDPESRFIDQFFWFWPERFGQGMESPPLVALAEGNIPVVCQTWERAAQSPGQGGWARHNLAVLAHLLALDLEHQAAQDGYRLPPPRVHEREAFWQEAWRNWRLMLADEEVWNAMRRRVCDLGEPQLTSDTVERLRTQLPEALVGVNAQLAVRAGEQGQEAETARQLALIRQSGMDAEVMESALARAVEPLRERVKLLCRKAEAESRADPTEGFQASMRLHKYAKPLLAVLTRLLAPQSHLRMGMLDEVALQMVDSLIRYYQKTKCCDSALLWQFGQALGLAGSPSARARIQAHTNVIQEACGVPAWYKADRYASI